MKHLHRYKFERFLTATYQIHYLLNLCVVPSGADVENCATNMCPWVRLFLTGFVKLYFDGVDCKSFATHYPSKKCHRVDLIKRSDLSHQKRHNLHSAWMRFSLAREKFAL